MNMELILSQPQPLSQNPAAIYIASLTAETGKRTQAQALRVIARMFDADINSLNWGALRYQHTVAIRAKIAQAYKPATANKVLSALRQTLKQAWLLGQMTAEEYGRAVKLERITGETLPAGRELSQGEILARPGSGTRRLSAYCMQPGYAAMKWLSLLLSPSMLRQANLS